MSQKKKWIKWGAAVLLSMGLVTIASAALETTQPSVIPVEPLYLPYFKLGGTRYFHGDSSAAQSYNFFLPLTQTPQQLLFADLRIFQRSGGSSEGNFQFGWRKIYRPDQAMFAIYGSWDLRKSIHDNLFHQVVIGGEHWYRNWFMGANYYLPVGPTQQSIGLPYHTVQRQTDFAKLRHFDTIQTWQDCERSQRGYDGEVGYAFTSQLTGYLGGYHFSNNHTPSTTGPRLRLTYDHFPQHGRLLGILDGVSLEAGVQHDRPRGTIGYLSLSLKIGMTNLNRNSNLTGFDRHLVELLRRDPDIVVQRAAQPAVATLQLKNWFTEEECQEYFAKIKEMSNEERYLALGTSDSTTYEQLLQTHIQKVINWLTKPKTQRRDQKMLFWMAKFYPLLSYYPSGSYTEGMAQLNTHYQEYFSQDRYLQEKSTALANMPVDFAKTSASFASPTTSLVERSAAPSRNLVPGEFSKKVESNGYALVEYSVVNTAAKPNADKFGLVEWRKQAQSNQLVLARNQSPFNSEKVTKQGSPTHPTEITSPNSKASQPSDDQAALQPLIHSNQNDFLAANFYTRLLSKFEPLFNHFKHIHYLFQVIRNFCKNCAGRYGYSWDFFVYLSGFSSKVLINNLFMITKCPLPKLVADITAGISGKAIENFLQGQSWSRMIAPTINIVISKGVGLGTIEQIILTGIITGTESWFITSTTPNYTATISSGTLALFGKGLEQLVVTSERIFARKNLFLDYICNNHGFQYVSSKLSSKIIRRQLTKGYNKVKNYTLTNYAPPVAVAN